MTRDPLAHWLAWRPMPGDRAIVKATGAAGRIVHLYDTGTAQPMAYVRLDGERRAHARPLSTLAPEASR